MRQCELTTHLLSYLHIRTTINFDVQGSGPAQHTRCQLVPVQSILGYHFIYVYSIGIPSTFSHIHCVIRYHFYYTQEYISYEINM